MDVDDMYTLIYDLVKEIGMDASEEIAVLVGEIAKITGDPIQEIYLTISDNTLGR